MDCSEGISKFGGFRSLYGCRVMVSDGLKGSEMAAAVHPPLSLSETMHPRFTESRRQMGLITEAR
jgi:hypothetical protein